MVFGYKDKLTDNKKIQTVAKKNLNVWDSSSSSGNTEKIER